MTVRSRIAPTPSGLLHEGNAYNFLLTWALVRAQGGELTLRIDDIDRDRCKPEYLEALFQDLHWLGIDWNLGPQSVEEQNALQQWKHIDRYREALDSLEKKALVFSCSCSRKDLESIDVYPGTCLKSPATHPPYAWRFKPEIPSEIELLSLNGLPETIRFDSSMQHSVIWRKEDLPAYHLVSVMEDQWAGTNLVVRGQDLLSSSLFQHALADALGDLNYAQIRYVHHPLIKDKHGHKLSKSKGSLALRHLREKERSPEALLLRFCEWMKFDRATGSILELPQLLAESLLRK
ncbi:MAG: glutamate--tRNA ligase family protein [Bacteroidota bacterium]|nr:glutamate--tRNA ligase family protein [Bacteroidota bacterium]MDX5430385.1 glutamate--tRNA ligase family protein [Bacteroidota bacterium]MDX5469146.1 glutamate--tRNA ligase family protein [Bacteroidota bacterium]